MEIQEPTLTPEGGGPPPIVRVKDLVKVYPGDIKAVQGVSFEVAEGEFFGFLGPNGAGKTTTMNMLVNLVRKTSGSVTIDGIDIDKNPREIYKRIGFAMQEIGLDETSTAREMFQLHGRLYHLPKQKIDSQIDRLLKLVELEKVADRFASTYSGGMRRRLDLALSLINEPRVLFLDEPTQGLDPHARQLIWNHLRELNRGGMTVFLTTHFMDEAEALCDRIAIIDKGQIVTCGTVGELLAQHSAKNLEEVFLRTTGSNLGNEEVNLNAPDPYARARG
ncbi:MAG: type transport system ATP-binding protein [Fimbriimonadaceae bacterium]|nr:type transport system ATP-binding protein [Fimbriimonadaceae bacterium]